MITPKHRCILATLVAAGALALGAQNAAANQPLTADELRATLADSTSSGESENGNTWHVYHGADGSMRGRSGPHEDIGRYEIRGEDLMCRKWFQWRNGVEACFHFYKVGDEQYVTESEDGSMTARFSLRRGNAEDL